MVGARPNFVKASAVFLALASYPYVEQVVIHTGQHCDSNMSDVFFEQIGLPEPEINLQASSTSQSAQTAEIMQRLEPVLIDRRPDWVVVYGDVTSTVAAALVCARLGIRVAHVEAGLRSFDRTMPEEINRVVTDQLSDLLFTPSEDGDRNLAREGVDPKKIHFVGNVMIDTLIRMLPLADDHMPANVPKRYAVITLHRPSNVDDTNWMKEMLANLDEISTELPIIFPLHPRTCDRMRAAGIALPKGVRFSQALPYLAFLALLQEAAVVITDSGGIQEETTFLNVPCLTVRENTERPVTVEYGTNQIVGRSFQRLRDETLKILAGNVKQGHCPPRWDGQSSQRIAALLTR